MVQFLIKRFKTVFTAAVLLIITPNMPLASSVDNILIKNIRYEKNVNGIIIEMSGKSACETIHIDGNSILVAVKNGVFKKPASIMNRDDHIVTDVSIDQLPGDILGLVIKTDKSISGINSNWISDRKSLLITIK